MTRLLILASMVFASAVFAQVEIVRMHENGDVIDADEINQNLDIVAKAVPPRDCSKDHIIKWDGSAWVCASVVSVVAPKTIMKNDCGENTTDCYAGCPLGTTVTGGGCYNNPLGASADDANEMMRHASVPRGNEEWHCSTNSGRYLMAHVICQ